MLDLKLIREDPDGARKALARRGGSYPIDEVLVLDIERRATQARLDERRAERKKEEKLVASVKGDEKKKLLARLKELSDEIEQLEREHDARASQLNKLLLEIPNIPHESVPEGDETNNVELRRWGEIRTFDFEPRDHLDLGEA